MTCRAACGIRPDGRGTRPVTCADCGAAGLTVYYTSQDQTLHLCPACFDARQSAGAARERRDR